MEETLITFYTKYYIIDEIPAQVAIPPSPSNELIPGPVNYETPLIKDIRKSSSLILLMRMGLIKTINTRK